LLFMLKFHLFLSWFCLNWQFIIQTNKSNNKAFCEKFDAFNSNFSASIFLFCAYLYNISTPDISISIASFGYLYRVPTPKLTIFSFRMCRVNSCCCCVDLEKGGKIWGWLGLIFGTLGLLKTGFDVGTMFKAGVLVTVQKN
jgi:hypothetical protein